MIVVCGVDVLDDSPIQRGMALDAWLLDDAGEGKTACLACFNAGLNYWDGVCRVSLLDDALHLCAQSLAGGAVGGESERTYEAEDGLTDFVVCFRLWCAEELAEPSCGCRVGRLWCGWF